MSKNYFLTKEVKDQDGGYIPHIVGYPFQVPPNYPLYESPMMNEPTGQRSTNNGVRIARPYHRTVLVNPRQQIQYSRPIYHIPTGVSNVQTDLKIEYLNKYTFYVSTPYKNIKKVLNEIYVDALVGTDSNTNIEIDSLRASFYTSKSNLIKRLNSINTNIPDINFKDSRKKVVSYEDLSAELSSKLGVIATSGCNSTTVAVQKDTDDGAGVILMVKHAGQDALILFNDKDKNQYADAGGGRKNKEDLRLTASKELQEESLNLFKISAGALDNNTAVRHKNYLGYFVILSGPDVNDLDKLKAKYDGNKTLINSNASSISDWKETNNIELVYLEDFKTALKNDTSSELKNVKTVDGTTIITVFGRTKGIIKQGLSSGKIKNPTKITLEHTSNYNGEGPDFIKKTSTYYKTSTVIVPVSTSSGCTPVILDNDKVVITNEENPKNEFFRGFLGKFFGPFKKRSISPRPNLVVRRNLVGSPRRRLVLSRSSSPISSRRVVISRPTSPRIILSNNGTYSPLDIK